MSKHETLDEERGVSVEMKNRINVKNLFVSDEGRGQVLFEGNLGFLLELSFEDSSVLEVMGTNGTLRVDLNLEEIEEMISKPHSRNLLLQKREPK